MDRTPRDSFVARVRAALGEFHPSERRLADVVLSVPGDMASYTATELAQLANVSNATVSRFVRKIGYASFDEARQAVRAEQHAGAPLFRFASDGAPLEGAVAAHLEQSRLNLERTAATTDPAAVDDLAGTLLEARRVRVGGFRAGQPMARYLGWQLQQVLEDVGVFPRDGETLAEALTTLGPADCAVLVVLRRAPALLSTALDAAHDTGAAVAVIGDLPELDRLPARWRFACVSPAPGPLLHHVAVMAVCNLVAARTIELSGPEGRRRMSRIEDVHARLGEL